MATAIDDPIAEYHYEIDQFYLELLKETKQIERIQQSIAIISFTFCISVLFICCYKWTNLVRGKPFVKIVLTIALCDALASLGFAFGYPKGDLCTAQSVIIFFFERLKYNENDAKILALQLIRAVQYMHGKGIVHRDIKCENILCTIGPDGSITLKITDFGHATECHDGVLLKQFDVGSPCYRPPEFIERRAYSKSCDMFSVGVVIYILLVGQYPYYPYDHNFVHKVINRLHLCASGNENMSNFWASISMQAQGFIQSYYYYQYTIITTSITTITTISITINTTNVFY
jgi:hypothetical protein